MADSKGARDPVRVPDDAPTAASKRTDEARDLLAEAVTINRPARELYDFWRDPRNLAGFTAGDLSR